ncbi:MAG: peptidylprolyl isomerase [Coriobacteriaceae bacterium]|nr:peptidylprolyl isomerase [Coriobacteriaceae bacterium]
MSNEGKTVRAHYRGTLDDGTQFDSSYDRGEPIEFTCGAHQMIAGFDAAVMDMAVGEKKTVHIPAAEAYGERREDLVLTYPAEQVPNIDQISSGDKLYLSGPGGQPVPVTVVSVDPATGVTLDANHELAGSDLNFDIELVSVEG